jgi:hypothetical protein
MIEDAEEQEGGSGCPICDHEDREEIEKGLTKVRRETHAIARKFDLDISALSAHARGHVKGKGLKRARLTEELEDVLGTLKNKAQALSSSPNQFAYLHVIREMNKTVELLAKLTGQIKTGTQINVLNSFIQDLGLKNEDEARRIIGDHMQAQSLGEAQRVEMCERFLQSAYQRRPELMSRSPFARPALPEAAEVVE